jgi:hypothetical protein
VNALASRLGRSRFARRVRAFATRGCVRGGLLGWASGAAWPGAWPTFAGVLADCLSAHRETSRPNLSLVHSSRGRNARTHKQPSPVGAKSRGQSARKRRTLVMAAEREGWRRAPPTLGMSHADIRRRTRAWPSLAAGVPANRLSAHREAPHPERSLVHARGVFPSLRSSPRSGGADCTACAHRSPHSPNPPRPRPQQYQHGGRENC